MGMLGVTLGGHKEGTHTTLPHGMGITLSTTEGTWWGTAHGMGQTRLRGADPTGASGAALEFNTKNS